MKKVVVVGISVACILIGIWYVFQDNSQITNYPPKNRTIVAFGDSLVFGYGSTEGNDFVSQLSKKLGRNIINLGVSGNTSQDGLLRVDSVIDQNPGTVLLLLGGNDTLRKVPQSETVKNLALIIEKLQKSGAVVVLLGVRGDKLFDDRDEMYRDLVERYHTFYVEDVLSGILLKPDLMFDGIHPNDRGYAIIADRLYTLFIKEKL